MSETEKNVQGQKPKTYGLAKWSLGLAVMSFLSAIATFIIPQGVCIFSLIFIIGVVAAPIFGVISILKIRRNKGQLKGTEMAIGGVVCPVALAIYVVMTVQAMAYRVMCGMNLSGSGSAISIYANDYEGKYPPPDKWCDFLIEYAEVTETQFRCPGNREERCSYAMNPNCGPNSSGDMVLLFETKGGWNQFGGPELLTFENHKGKGCNVLFNDGRVEFVKPKQLGELKWEVEEGE